MGSLGQLRRAAGLNFTYNVSDHVGGRGNFDFGEGQWDAR